jgi:hypothetical protein
MKVKTRKTPRNKKIRDRKYICDYQGMGIRTMGSEP